MSDEDKNNVQQPEDIPGGETSAAPADTPAPAGQEPVLLEDEGVTLKLAGGFVQKIDAKGRFTFPKKLRSGLADGGGDPERVVITRGARLKGFRHLWAMPAGEWDRMVEKINRLPESDEKMRVSMHFVGGKEECEMDKFGRLLLSSTLRSYAGAESGELFIMGIGRKIVIMDRALYEKYLSQENYDEQIESDVDKLGI